MAPLPAYAEPGVAAERARLERQSSGARLAAAVVHPPGRRPMPTCWSRLAGSFRYDGEIDGLLARIGAISSKKGVRYWSTTEKNWQMLVTDAFALSGPDAALRRADFKPAELTKGQSHSLCAERQPQRRQLRLPRARARRRPRARVIESENLTPIKKMMVTLYRPGDLQTLYVIERRAPGQWNFYSLTRTRMASSMLPTGSEASYINRSVAFYRHVAGIPTDQEPPAAR